MTRARLLQAAPWFVLLVAATWLAWRGFWRGAVGDTDVAVRYHAAVEWLADRNPYAFAEGYGLGEQSLHVDFPATLLAFAPLAAFSWPEARLIATLVSAAAAVFIGLGVVRLIGWPHSSPKALLMMAFLIAFAPSITTLALGQTGLVATAAIVAAMLLERSGRSSASGAMYGVATVLKFTIGAPFLAYLLWRRRWLPALISLAVFLGPTLLSALRMELAGTAWLETWRSNLAVVSGPGGLNDPDPSNEARLSLVNLAYPLSSLMSDAMVVNTVSVAAILAAGLLFAWLRQGRDARPDLLALSVVAVLGLLITYHRYYDAVLLAIPMAWAGSVLSGPSRRLGVVVLMLCGSFVAPFQTLTDAVAQRVAVLPAALTESPLWNAVALAQHTWALVMMIIVLLVATVAERRQTVEAR